MKIGTRKSPLALAQAHMVRDRLLAAWPGMAVEIVPMMTSGDRFLAQPLAEIGGKGLFTKEIEEALLSGDIDIAVHSMKDMPTVLPDGLMIGAMLEREDVRDVLIGADSIEALPKGAVVGTSSLRRSAQMLMLRPDLQMAPIRGNVQTRLDKIARGDMQATLLAKAGLNRLNLILPPPLRGRAGWGVNHIPAEPDQPPTLILPLKGGGNIVASELSLEQCLPAVAQGAIGIECRIGDTAVLEKLKPLSHAPTEIAVACERAFLKVLDGSCRTPIAGYAHIIPSPSQGEGKGEGQLHFQGLLAATDGSSAKRVEMSGDISDAEKLGREAGLRIKQ